MFVINLNAEIVACTVYVVIQKIAPRGRSGKYFQIWFFPRFGGKNGVVLSMHMQVILDSSFARPGSAPIWGGKKGEFRDWTIFIAGLQRAKRASEAPWVRKIGNPSSRENLVMTSAYDRASERPYRLGGRGRSVSRSPI